MSDPTHCRRPALGPVLGPALAAAALTVLAACGGGSGSAVESDGASGTAPVAEGDLPVLPPVEERDPGLFDDQGCLVTGPDEVDCATTADQVDAQAAGAREGDERSLAGFLGSRWVEGAAASAPVVLVDTVHAGAGDDGSWVATGLARNETDAAVGAIEVTATLRGADGSNLGVVTAVSPVRDVRSGEPVPFELRSDVVAADVADVTWSATPVDGVGDGGTRQLELAVYWVRPEGDPQPIDLYLYRDEGGARPHALFGSATAVGGATVPAPRLVVAWLDAGGRVLAVDTAPVVDPTGAPVAELAPGRSGDALVVHDGGVGDSLADAAPMIWGLAG